MCELIKFIKIPLYEWDKLCAAAEKNIYTLPHMMLSQWLCYVVSTVLYNSITSARDKDQLTVHYPNFLHSYLPNK